MLIKLFTIRRFYFNAIFAYLLWPLHYSTPNSRYLFEDNNLESFLGNSSNNFNHLLKAGPIFMSFLLNNDSFLLFHEENFSLVDFRLVLISDYFAPLLPVPIKYFIEGLGTNKLVVHFLFRPLILKQRNFL